MSKHRTGASSLYGGPAPTSPLSPSAAPGETHAGLVLLYAPHFEALQPAYAFREPELVIGRDAESAVCVPEQAVSRKHARIRLEGGRWVLEDLESRNGTMVDGAYVTAVELAHQQEIRVGDALFKFVEAGAERFLPYRLDGVVSPERQPREAHELLGGAQMDAIAEGLARIAKTELSCVILGETGTGKEVAARALHRLSTRKGSFQAINCAAIPGALLESELFGYRRGAFSGADRDKPGLVKLADGGTLFLDEIGDMPLEAQAKLLRVLQAREVFPLGGTAAEAVDLRVVCATHRDLPRLVKEGTFRGDLFARLNEHAVRLPPLRERKEDLYLLSRAFTARYGRKETVLSFSFLVALLHYDWPFNVRELESCIKRGVALATSDVLDTPQLPDAIAEAMGAYGQRPPAPEESGEDRAPFVTPEPTPAVRRAPPSEAELRELLARHKGNVAAVGREFGKERMQVHRWLKRFGIRAEDYREGSGE